MPRRLIKIGLWTFSKITSKTLKTERLCFSFIKGRFANNLELENWLKDLWGKHIFKWRSWPTAKTRNTKTFSISSGHTTRGLTSAPGILEFQKTLLLRFTPSSEHFTIQILKVFPLSICISITFCSSCLNTSSATQTLTFKVSIWNLFYFLLWHVPIWANS